MTDAYVMLNCELGAETGIIEQLLEIEQVVDVFETIGTHDMMVKLQAENLKNPRDCFMEYTKTKKHPCHLHPDKKR